jgi:hypothetical protein
MEVVNGGAGRPRLAWLLTEYDPPERMKIVSSRLFQVDNTGAIEKKMLQAELSHRAMCARHQSCFHPRTQMPPIETYQGRRISPCVYRRLRSPWNPPSAFKDIRNCASISPSAMRIPSTVRGPFSVVTRQVP